MTTKHTPGPLQVREAYSKGEPIGYVVYAGREIIAEIPGTSPHDLANARLIAAAPELKEELIDRNKAIGCLKVLFAQKDFTGMLEIFNRYQIDFTDGPIAKSQAIAKAEGRE